jgi:hypothetical protein
LNLTLELTGLSFRKDELDKLIEEQVKNSLPAGYEFKPEGLSSNFRLKSTEKTGAVIFEVNVEIKMLPQIDSPEIISRLVGKKPSIGQSYLSQLPNVVDSKIVLHPNIWGRLTTFPRLAKNIQIKVVE